MSVSSLGALEIWGAVFCLIAAIAIDRGRRAERRENLELGYMLLINCMLLVCVCLAQEYDGIVKEYATIFVKLSQFLIYFLMYILCYFVMRYIDRLVSSGGGQLPGRYILLSKIAVIVNMVMLVFNLYNRRLYYFDNNNHYHRGSLYVFSQVGPVIILILAIIVVIKYGRYCTRAQLIGVSSFVALPIIAVIVVSFSNDKSPLINIAITVSLLAMYVIYESERADRMVAQTEALLEKEKINNQFKNAMLWTQVQPHFIYNNLNVIQFLCKKNPEEAQQAIGHLSSFLRSYIDAYDLDVCVPVEEELEIVNHYIYMQKLRYNERLNVEIDVKTKDFMVPPLCIEVLVENAVKHGVMKKIEGGDVKISLYDTDDEYIVDVSDNGVGFDAKEVQADGQNHVGLKNADGRLHYMCKGYLEIHSAIGEGCNVKIHIPKER